METTGIMTTKFQDHQPEQMLYDHYIIKKEITANFVLCKGEYAEFHIFRILSTLFHKM